MSGRISTTTPATRKRARLRFLQVRTFFGYISAKSNWMIFRLINASDPCWTRSNVEMATGVFPQIDGIGICSFHHGASVVKHSVHSCQLNDVWAFCVTCSCTRSCTLYLVFSDVGHKKPPHPHPLRFFPSTKFSTNGKML